MKTFYADYRESGSWNWHRELYVIVVAENNLLAREMLAKEYPDFAASRWDILEIDTSIPGVTYIHGHES